MRKTEGFSNGALRFIMANALRPFLMDDINIHQGVNTMSTKEKQESTFLNKLFTGISLIYLLLGAMMILIPELQLQYICYGISIVLLILGIVFIVKYFLTESYKNLNQYGFSIGVFLVIIGICTLVRNEQMAKSFQTYIGVCILLTAIIKLQNAMDLKALKDRAWSVICIVSVVIMVCAIIIIIDPFSDHNYEIALTYFSLLFDGIISLFSYNYLAFRLKRSEKKQRMKKATKNQEKNREEDQEQIRDQVFEMAEDEANEDVIPAPEQENEENELKF